MLNLNDGDIALDSGAANVSSPFPLTQDIRPDTVFPFIRGRQQSANILTNPALDPTICNSSFALSE